MITNFKTIVLERSDLAEGFKDLAIEHIHLIHMNNNASFQDLAESSIILFIDEWRFGQNGGRIPTKILKNRWGDKGVVIKE